MSIEQAVGGMLISLLFVLIMVFLGRKWGYFRLPPEGIDVPIAFWQTFLAFLMYFLIPFLILLPLLTHSILVSAETMLWIKISAFYFTFFALVVYVFFIPRESALFIFWGEKKPSKKRVGKAILMGFVTWIISLPFVYLMTMLTTLISLLLWKEANVQQAAVQELKKTFGFVGPLTMMVILIVVIAPFIEELLFRGFLQGLLKRYLRRSVAIFMTALIFAFFHYTRGQGKGNFPLISSIFVLGCFLGFIYERERTLWASYTLHSTFNAYNVLFLIFLPD